MRCLAYSQGIGWGFDFLRQERGRGYFAFRRNQSKRCYLLIHPFLWTEDVYKRELVLERLFQETEKKNKDYKLKLLELWHKNPRAKNYDKLIEKHKQI